jgi:hypothetical protein
MTTIAGVKMANMAKPKESLSPKNVGKLSPDPYSYEHRISLDQDALDKMGVTETPKVGDVFHVLGQGHVHSVSSNNSVDGKPSLSVGIQMRKMGMQKKGAGTPKAGGAFAAVSKGVQDASEV